MLLTLLGGAIVLFLLSLLRDALRPGLVNIPGPAVAKFTNVWRLYKLWQWRFKEDLPGLHEKYNSSLVRIGPKMVSCSDPRAVELIYGFHTEFKKVRMSSVNLPMDKKAGPAMLMKDTCIQIVQHGEGNGAGL